MANTFFQFKQFTVHQEHCAMKVCTDACIQGAFTAQYLRGATGVHTILDIGAGTGLLSLMLAQAHPAAITAIELDAGAALQSRENFAASPWADRLSLLEADVRALQPTALYDFVITNPPFYESALKSGHAQKDQAMHATNLDYAALLQAIAAHLKPGGSFSVLLPYQEFLLFRELAERAGFHACRLLQVKQSVRHGYFRTVGIFSRELQTTVEEELDIRDAHNNYTAAFTALLQPYYLKL
ncbi:tRNA1Val (adenine37-N6)-methyltransferase [Chitinophaga dinghuensis]|uniref:tRNA1(Val) (adenine(37)-N6)-methyltransferase n=1 Tax=Chitinophaga dinghuensis TaxID=1539050 RepID=A0A327W249_9BACT|nr:methyltransferase [Chitinophaga dinghuensis]RAJ82376.1 tRNA1Val (adenine37-N6)-methyltransferase [Chitinophaga dinghuensis]